MLYDAMLMIAVQFVATIPFLPFVEKDQVLVVSDVGVLAYVYHVWQVAVATAFFGIFWTRQGRTLGMQAWRLQMRTVEGKLPTWRDSLQRLLLALMPWLPSVAVLTTADYVEPRTTLLWIGSALLALGFANYFCAWFDPQRRSWHDRFLRTRVVREA